MKQSEILNKIDELIQDAKTAVLATVDPEGFPCLRWMTPGLLKTRPGKIYAVTPADAAKTAQLEKSPRVQWLFQNRSLTEIVRATGLAVSIDSPGLKQEVLEELGDRFSMYWKINPDNSEFTILETAVTDAVYFRPMTGERTETKFEQEK